MPLTGAAHYLESLPWSTKSGTLDTAEAEETENAAAWLALNDAPLAVGAAVGVENMEEAGDALFFSCSVFYVNCEKFA